MNVMNKISLKNFWFYLLALYFPYCYSQSLTDHESFERGDLRLMFYNVENFFDAEDDSLYNDSEFLPDAGKNWDDYKFHQKAVNIFKTIAAVGGSKPPEIICLAEVENKKALLELCLHTPLSKYEYGIVHYESPDTRGIDVALIYKKKEIKALESMNYEISFPGSIPGITRDILYFKALVNKRDTLHLFINHWPSRRGGKSRSEPRRMYVAEILRSKIDSIVGKVSCSAIIVTGDFNDEPADKSLSGVLRASLGAEKVYCDSLYNLSALLQESCSCGTYKYRGSWNMIDQFIVSGAMLKNGQSISTCRECMHVADFEFLLLEDEKYGGWKPDRTYLGPVYKGGTSDHLPIYLDLYF